MRVRFPLPAVKNAIWQLFCRCACRPNASFRQKALRKMQKNIAASVALSNLDSDSEVETLALQTAMHQPTRIAVLLLLFAFLAVTTPVSAADAGATGSSSDGSSKLLGNFGFAPFQVSLSLQGGYDDNLSNTKVNPQGSAFTAGSLSLTYKFGDDRTRVSVEVGSGLTYYFKRVTSNTIDPNASLNFSLTHKATARLTLAITAFATYQQEPDFGIRLGLNRRSGNFFYTNDKFAGTFFWTPRFSTATSYTLGVVRYDSAAGSFENRIENTIGNEFRFLVWPTTTAVAEYRFQVVTYNDINRDSVTHFALVGFDHNFNPRLNVVFRGGGQFRRYDNNVDKSSPYFEGTLNYAVGKDTSVSWINRYAIEEPDTLLNPSRESFRTGLQARHNFTARVSGSLAAYYQNDNYDSIGPPTPAPSFSEESFDAVASLRYAVTRYFGVEVGYSHTEVISDIFVREYSRNRFYGGLNLTF
jgi:hypothetical protein